MFFNISLILIEFNPKDVFSVDPGLEGRASYNKNAEILTLGETRGTLPLTAPENGASGAQASRH